MAQAGSAQREPSMEEILASIRKIIEETEHTRDDAAPAARPSEKPAEAARPSPQPAPREADISAFREAIADIDDAPDAPDTPPVEQEHTSAAITLAEVQRRLAGEDHDKADVAAHLDFVDDMTPALEQDDAGDAPEDVQPPAYREEQTPYAEEPASRPEPTARAAASSPAAAQAADAGSLNGSRAALMSPDAGRQVAGSFEELKEAFMASRQKSFDEMAQEMLRPMLQEWLDNNLPVLVERLVREEIERIARG